MSPSRRRRSGSSLFFVAAAAKRRRCCARLVCPRPGFGRRLGFSSIQPGWTQETGFPLAQTGTGGGEPISALGEKGSAYSPLLFHDRVVACVIMLFRPATRRYPLCLSLCVVPLLFCLLTLARGPLHVTQIRIQGHFGNKRHLSCAEIVHAWPVPESLESDGCHSRFQVGWRAVLPCSRYDNVQQLQ